jgi:hypothetical protein
MKNLYTTIIAVVLTASAIAQSKTSSTLKPSSALKPSFGVRAGVTSTSIKGDANSSLQNILEYTDGIVTTSDRTGFFGGAFASIPLTKGFAVEPGVFYSQKGYTLNGDLNIKGVEFLAANAKAKLQSEYIDIPVLLKADLGGFQVFAGPQFSYLMKSNLKTTAGALGFNLLNETFDVTEQFNRWDAGVTGGVGYRFTNGMNIMASYDHGLSKVDKNQNMAAYNRGFKVGIGIGF